MKKMLNDNDVIARVSDAVRCRESMEHKREEFYQKMVVALRDQKITFNIVENELMVRLVIYIS